MVVESTVQFPLGKEPMRIRFRGSPGVCSGAGLGIDRSLAALLLHPWASSRASKTREYDETVIVDDPMLAGSGACRTEAQAGAGRAPDRRRPSRVLGVVQRRSRAPEDRQDSGPSGPARAQSLLSKRTCLEQASGPHRHTKPEAVYIGNQYSAIREGGGAWHISSVCVRPLWPIFARSH